MPSCLSPNLERVTKASVAADDQVAKLQQSLLAKQQEYKKQFGKLVDEGLAQNKVTDGSPQDAQTAIQVDFASEFNLDAIANAVTAALKLVAQTSTIGGATGIVTGETIDAYTDIVNALAAAARFNSSTGKSYSFAMNRIAPGLFSFVYTTSTTIKDKRLFGSDAVTATVYCYQVIQSVGDVKSTLNFTSANQLATIITEFRAAQLDLAKSFRAGGIDFATYQKLDQEFETAVVSNKKKLDSIQPSLAKRPFVEAVDTAFAVFKKEMGVLAKLAAGEANFAPALETVKARAHQ